MHVPLWYVDKHVTTYRCQFPIDTHTRINKTQVSSSKSLGPFVCLVWRFDCLLTDLGLPSCHWILSPKLTTVNVLNFQTLFLFLLSKNNGNWGWNSQIACQNSKQGRPWSDFYFRLLLLCMSFGRQLVFEILEHLPYCTTNHWRSYLYAVSTCA